MPAVQDPFPHREDHAPDAESQRELWRRWREERDNIARQRLIDHFLPYAKVVAATYYGRRVIDDVSFDDYHQLACVGLMESVDRYDPSVGVQFKTFAARRMHGAILDGLEVATEKHQQVAAGQRLKRERLADIKAEASERSNMGKPAPPGRASPAASHADKLFKYLSEVGLGLAISYLLEDTGMVARVTEGQHPQAENFYYQGAELRQLQQHVRDMVRRLPEQERIVITRHYLHHHQFDEVARDLQLTKGRISQIHRKALETLRAQLGRRRRSDVDL